MQGKQKIISDSDEFILVPKRRLDRIEEDLQKILGILEKDGKREKSNNLGDYISEAEAQELLGRKTTWFWLMRNTGRLQFTKVGRKVFYMREDLLSLFQEPSKVNATS